ncbi:hypothetical protein J2W54_004956 [Rhodococcus fascians]|uniref:hypothetical protein n=1 Tax=Nocardiaceae TaxID=85025 RepID=UPI00285C6EF9|nr:MULTISPECIES: hypothetical protein [Rhodococcus]MDR6912943.1 hypothetical protein [Rhodococcus sp. 3258]MDR6934540.1 hypothetical protein [Rhodococcus fascians]
MSARKRRAAFDPNALNDLDDVLPPLNLVGDAAAASSVGEDAADAPEAETAGATVDRSRASETLTAEAPPQPRSVALDEEPSSKRSGQIEAATTEFDEKQSSARRADARRKSARRDASIGANRVAPPEVALPEEIYSALRSLTLEERSVDPTTARSYGQVVLDAVEQHADELQAHWERSAATSSGGLFKRAEAGRPIRRRHNAPRARVPLAGVINADAAVLDQLASDWGAGSRSALVEQALRLYLRVD